MSGSLPIDRKAIIRDIWSDFPRFAEKCLRITTKEGLVRQFKMNQAQMYIHSRLQDQIARTGKVRSIISKGRQQGVSTYTEGRFYWRVTGSIGKKAFILTHDREATDNLFGMVSRFHEHMPAAIKPETEAANAKELFFGKIESGYKIGTAGNKAVGRGSTVQFLHGSEVAFWPNAEEHLAGLLQAVPNSVGTEVILESTSNGVGGLYYDMCNDAKEGKGAFELIFVPWFWQPEYRITPDADEEVKYDEEEEFLASTYGLDDAQILWRRNKIYELKDPELFRQEYPFTVEESFIASGRSAFARQWLQSAFDECYSPQMHAEVLAGKKEISPREDGELWVWDKPQPGRKYYIGADPAEGLAKGDFSAIQVLDDYGNQVAEYRAHVEPDVFADVLAALGHYYNRAIIGVERNNHGQLTLYRLAKQLGYPKVYTQADLEYQSSDKMTKKYGWLTTSRTKPLMIDYLISIVRDGMSGAVSKRLVDEMQTYVIDERGRYNAVSGKYDDLLMAYAIAQQMFIMHRKKKHAISSPEYRPVDSLVGF